MRRGEAAQGTAPEAAAPPVRKRLPMPASPPRGRWILFTVLAICMLAATGLGATVLVVSYSIKKIEPQLKASADKALDEERFEDAAASYRQLQQRYPDSLKLPEYVAGQLYAELRGRLQKSPDAAGALDELDSYIRQHAEDPAAAVYLPKVSQLVVQRIAAFRKENDPAKGRSPLTVAGQADKMVDTLTSLPGGLDAEQRTQTANDLKRVRLAVDHWQQHEDALQKLDRFQSTWHDIKDARQYVKDTEKQFPGFRGEAAEQLRNLETQQADKGVVILHTPPEVDPPSVDTPPSWQFVSRPLNQTDGVKDGGPSPVGPKGVEPFLSRGVLYVLSRDNGALLWGRRVGIDTTVLPVRLSGEGVAPDRLLVWAADTRTLTCLDEDGRTEHWHYFLGRPLAGKPLVVENHVFLAGLDGEVHMLAVADGRFLNRFLLGQTLTVGGVVEPGTPAGIVRLWFAADEGCIYVFDVSQPEKPVCKQVVETGHPAGSLRCEPFFLPGGSGQPDSGYLALIQSTPAGPGPTGQRLRFFSLPVTGRYAKEAPLTAGQHLVGWSWTAPYHDSERVAVPTDAARLGLFGVDQPGTNDPVLFPLVPGRPGGLDLTPRLWPDQADPAPPTRSRSRAQVLHVRGDTFWVMARGRLQRLEQGWTAGAGPVLLPAWKNGLPLGTLMYEATTAQDAHGRLTFYLTTQDPTGSAQVASAVSEDGKVLWQRRLGLMVHGQPRLLTALADANRSLLPLAGLLGPTSAPGLLLADAAGLSDRAMPLVLTTGADGALFAFDPLTPVPAQTGLIPAHADPVARGFDVLPDQAVQLLVGADSSAYQVAPIGKDRLEVRRVAWADTGRQLRVTGEAEIPLPAMPAGTPALVGQSLILPLDKGYLARVMLTGDAQTWKVEKGLNWRAPAAGTAARGHVTAVGPDWFLITDGLGGLALRNWKEILGSHDLGPARRIVGPPLLLPGEPLRAVVADAAGGVTLLTLKPDAQRKLPAKWIDLDGPITSGPFLCSAPGAPLRVGCLLDGHTLVQFDPQHPNAPRPTDTARDETSHETHFVAPPQMVRSWLIAADLGGRIFALDAHNLEPRGSYQLRATVVPTATPVPFGPDRLFVPLSDGTVLLLPLEMIGKDGK